MYSRGPRGNSHARNWSRGSDIEGVEIGSQELKYRKALSQRWPPDWQKPPGTLIGLVLTGCLNLFHPLGCVLNLVKWLFRTLPIFIYRDSLGMEVKVPGISQRPLYLVSETGPPCLQTSPITDTFQGQAAARALSTPSLLLTLLCVHCQPFTALAVPSVF